MHSLRVYYIHLHACQSFVLATWAVAERCSKQWSSCLQCPWFDRRWHHHRILTLKGHPTRCDVDVADSQTQLADCVICSLQPLHVSELVADRKVTHGQKKAASRRNILSQLGSREDFSQTLQERLMTLVLVPASATHFHWQCVITSLQYSRGSDA